MLRSVSCNSERILFEALLSGFDGIKESVIVDGIKVAAPEDMPFTFSKETDFVILKSQTLFEQVNFYLSSYYNEIEKLKDPCNSTKLYLDTRQVTYNFIYVITGSSRIKSFNNAMIEKVDFDNSDQKDLATAILLCSRKFHDTYLQFVSHLDSQKMSHLSKVLSLVFGSLLKKVINGKFGGVVAECGTYFRELRILCDSIQNRGSENKTSNTSVTSSLVSNMNSLFSKNDHEQLGDINEIEPPRPM